MRGDLIGFRVLGRHGVLGHVVGVSAAEPGVEAEVLIRGGVSRGLLYVVPEPRIRSVALRERTLVADVEFGDFVPSLQSDGTVELRVLL